jgi:hemerythrin
MAQFIWTEQLNIGIEVIDQQHRKIVDYINQLDDASCNGHPREEIAAVILQLKDYTRSHFAFEESMQEEAGYPLLDAHKKEHERFIQRVSDYQYQFTKGEDVSKALSGMLITWLFNHIKRDDVDYVASVKSHLQQQSGFIDDFVEKKKGYFSRLFE